MMRKLILMLKHKKLRWVLLFCIVCFIASFQILIIGEMGSAHGLTSITKFRGFERLIGLWPLAIGAFFFYVAYITVEEDFEPKDKNDSDPFL